MAYFLADMLKLLHDGTKRGQNKLLLLLRDIDDWRGFDVRVHDRQLP